jgi:protein TonB
MNTPSTGAMPRPWYGAFELKRTYQRNLGMGVLWAAGLHIALIGGFLLYKWIQERASAIDNAPSVVIRSMSDIAPPPSMTAAKPQVNVAEPNIAPPSIGIPTPVPDEEVVEEVRFATKEELAQMSAPIVSAGDNDGDGNVVVDIPLEEYFPTADEFVAVQEMPTIIKEEKPIYPEVALLTNREATVWVKALVDKEGKVREARIAKSSGMNVGFDEAALEAAYKNFYKPAIQNGRPVAIWVTYPVEFKLK